MVPSDEMRGDYDADLIRIEPWSAFTLRRDRREWYIPWWWQIEQGHLPTEYCPGRRDRMNDMSRAEARERLPLHVRSVRIGRLLDELEGVMSATELGAPGGEMDTPRPTASMEEMLELLEQELAHHEARLGGLIDRLRNGLRQI